MPRPFALTFLLVLAAVLGSATLPAGAAPEGVRVVEAWPGLAFESPIGVVDARDGTATLYVLEQPGRIVAVENGSNPTPGAQPKKRLFLDLTKRVFPRLQGGVLGLAFHPRYRENGRLFVSWCAETGHPQVKFKVVLAEFRARTGQVDPATERLILEIPKTTALHNGGGLVFGPDGKLYVGTGDNAIEQQAVQTAQSPGSLLGKILRHEVDAIPAGHPYGIPTDNPWATAGPGVRPEIWAYGFRNAWRFSFDATGTLWVCQPGTKGADCRETVFHVERGGNHGWPYFEGSRPAHALPENLSGTRFVKPLHEYIRPDPEEGTSASIGGHVYRGTRVPSLKHHFVFGDYGMNAVWALERIASDYRLHRLGTVKTVSSLGEDAKGELYICSHEEGKVYTLR